MRSSLAVRPSPLLALTLDLHHLHLTICAPPCELSIRSALPTNVTLAGSPFLAGPTDGGRLASRCGRVGEEVGHDTHKPLGLLPVEQVPRLVEALQAGVGEQAGQHLGVAG